MEVKQFEDKRRPLDMQVIERQYDYIQQSKASSLLKLFEEKLEHVLGKLPLVFVEV